MDSLELARFIVDVIEDKKGEDITLLDLRPKAIIADFFVICTGTSERQLNALVDHVRDEVKEKQRIIPLSREGTGESGWVLLDYGSVVVHIFTRGQREFYDLEGFWEELVEANVILSIQ